MDVEHTKAQWIEKRADALFDHGYDSVEALEWATKDWEKSDTAALAAAIDRVQSLHSHERNAELHLSFGCRGCRQPYPCPTIRALEMKP